MIPEIAKQLRLRMKRIPFVEEEMARGALGPGAILPVRIVDSLSVIALLSYYTS